MAHFDRISCIFWIGIALLICFESIRIGPGSWRNPGPGFFPLGAGILIGIFGIFILIQTYKRREEGKEQFWKKGRKLGKVVSTVTSILAYAFLIDTLGFHLVTFLWVGYVCCWVGEMDWKKAIVTSVATTFLSFLLFERYLGIHFSKGALGF